jgi:dTDP-4-amino-4,6-dideoxygalactose transaminase
MSISFLDLGAMHAELRPELDLVWQRVVDGSAFIGGEAVDRFEAEWAAYCGTRHCVGLSDGTAALELALAALGVGPGDEVIVPANTFIATVEAVAAVGAVPVMIDVDPATLLMTGEAVRAACTPRTAAVIAVHLDGQPVDMDAIRAVAEPAGIAVIEDAAQAHGATWRGARAGSLGHVGCFSFYPGKNLGAFGDAGGVVTDDAELAQRIRCLANHGRPRGAAERHVLMGQNHRLDGLQAAILSVKLRRLDAWNAARRRLARNYGEALQGLPVEPVSIRPEAVSSHHLAVVQVPQRDELRRLLAAEGIATGVHYAIPCHLQPACSTYATPPLPVVERAAGRLLSLPMHPHLGDRDVGRVASALARALDRLEPTAFPGLAA